MTSPARTQVGIVGAGPAGLLLAHLLSLEGIESVVLERQTRSHIEHRVRAGLLEPGTVDLLTASGVGDRLAREALVHEGIQLQSDSERHRLAITQLTGASLYVYGQQEVVKDLLAARDATGGPLHFEVEDVELHDLTCPEPRITYRHEGAGHELRCDVIAGCDGWHGVSRPSVPPGALQLYRRTFPFAWLGILAAVRPSVEELVYVRHDRGFALHSMRSQQLSRLYLQVPAGTSLEGWSDLRIWEELQTRFRLPGWRLEEGPIVERSVAEQHAFVATPMRWGNLVLAGDAAHIVPSTGAKGLNLAVNDVRLLAPAIVDHLRRGRSTGL
ncbi:MAG: 4-hydroxybenzoate 3-monooxygenase, partial [Candidatus Dormibacteraeota bacterium]|nr:4-hydroxybenzoate 3-monooxygenase [Candidatus Dormibacteraeota bacterium]